MARLWLILVLCVYLQSIVQSLEVADNVAVGLSSFVDKPLNVPSDVSDGASLSSAAASDFSSPELSAAETVTARKLHETTANSNCRQCPANTYCAPNSCNCLGGCGRRSLEEFLGAEREGLESRIDVSLQRATTCVKCAPCPAGKGSPVGSYDVSQCTGCQAGTYKSGSSCVACPAGQV